MDQIKDSTGVSLTEVREAERDNNNYYNYNKLIQLQSDKELFISLIIIFKCNSGDP